MLTTCRNALSVLELLVKAIGSAVVARTFWSWTSGGAWGCFVVSAVFRTYCNWDREEAFVMDYVLGAGDPTETSPLVQDRA
jgi:hypothetical protein